MKEQMNEHLLNNAPYGYALLKMIKDGGGLPSDSMIIETNQLFLEIIDSQNNSIKNTLSSTCFSEIIDDYSYWLKRFSEIAQQTFSKSINERIKIRNNSYLIYIYSPQIDYVILMLHNLSSEKVKEIETSNFFDINLDLLCVANPQGYFIKINKAWERTLGYTTDYILKHKFNEFIHPDDIMKTNEAIKQLSQNQELSKFINRYRSKSGDYRYIEWHSKIINNQIYAAARDITKRVELEKKQQTDLDKYNRLFNNNFSIIVLSSFENKKIVDVNSAFLNLFNAKKDIFIGGTNTFLDRKFTYKNEEDTFANLIKKYGVVRDLDIKITTHVPEPVYGLLSGEVFETDQEKYFLTFMIDVTEQKKNEKQLKYYFKLQNILRDFSTNLINISTKDIADSINNVLAEIGSFFAGDRVYLFDYDLENQELSNKYEWCAEGIDPMIDSLQKIPFSELKDFVAVHLKNESLIIDDVSSYNDQAVKQTLDFQGVLSIMTVPIFSNDKCLGFVGIDFVKRHKTFTTMDKELLDFFVQSYVNIISRIDSEQSLQTANKLLIHKTEMAEEYAQKAFMASKAKSQFLANMSHEIRTPLNGVIGFSELLLTTELSEIQKEYAGNTISSAHSLLDIINDILDFSKIESGKLELDVIKTDIVEMIEQTENIIKFNTSKKGVEFLVEISPNVPRFVLIDNIRLKQVIINLLSNAVKFTIKGEVKLKVSFKKTSKFDGILYFEVDDTGIGISEKQKEKLFKAFSQADTSTTRKFGGTGLGLIISNNLVKMMGGIIEFDSKEGQGSKFYFSIKVEFEEREKFNRKDISNIKTILCIDDNQQNLLILKDILLSWHIEPTCVDNGAEALKLLQKGNRYDVIIVDYVMPDLNGLDVVKTIRQDLKLTQDKQPIILLYSSKDDKTIHAISAKLDISFIMTKPVKHTELYRYLLKAVDRFYFQKKKSEEQKRKNLEIIHLDTPPKILIAEDNILNMKLITIIITRLIPNVIIFKAENGKIAYNLFNKNNIDMVFMDLTMPEMDGIRATELIRKQDTIHKVPIIALTANVINEDRIRCLSAGMDDFLVKPINKQELVKIFNKYLRKAKNDQL